MKTGVAAVGGDVDLLRHPLADLLVGHAVVFADAEVEQLPLGMIGEGLTLGPLDLLELVDGGRLAVLGAADAVGEELLEVGVGHGEGSGEAIGCQLTAIGQRYSGKAEFYFPEAGRGRGRGVGRSDKNLPDSAKCCTLGR